MTSMSSTLVRFACEYVSSSQVCAILWLTDQKLLNTLNVANLCILSGAIVHLSKNSLELPREKQRS